MYFAPSSPGSRLGIFLLLFAQRASYDTLPTRPFALLLTDDYRLTATRRDFVACHTKGQSQRRQALAELAERTFRDAFGAMNAAENMDLQCRTSFGMGQ